MKVLECFIALTLLSVVNSHPINMICVPACNPDITVNEGFITEWLNNSRTTGLIDDLLNIASTDVSQLITQCLKYQ